MSGNTGSGSVAGLSFVVSVSPTASAETSLMPVMRKQQYRFQATNPNPQTKGRYACAPIGASTTFMSAGQVYPAIGEDMGYLVWRKRNCCAL